jgi:hypothetical protein
MLRSITLDFYYRNKAIYTTFNGICNTIYNYFKGLEYKCGVLIKWNAITLKTVIVTGLSQSRHERRKERMQACTIGMSINEDIKLRSRRWW